jgi:hypothetical protein
MVERVGLPFQPGAEPVEDDVRGIRERLPVVSALEASVLGNRELFGRLATTAMLPAMEQTCAQWRPDLVLREPCEYASAIVALRRGIPTAQVAISLAAGEVASIAAAAPALEEHRQGLVDELLASPYLTRFPASLDPSSFATTVRFRESRSHVPRSLPDWWGGSDAPLVYMTFGTVLGHMSIAADVYRAALDAISRLPVRGLLTVGHQFDRSVLGPIPPNVRVEAWVDQADVLPQAALVVCHGGSGTAFGAVAGGVPVVVVPLFADQFVNGRRIADSGAGLVVEADPGAGRGPRRAIEEHDAPRIAGAVEAALGEPSHRIQARRIAAEMAAAPTVDEVLDTFLTGALHEAP